MINEIVSMYFSPTKTTEKIVKTIANQLKNSLKYDCADINFTYAKDRLEVMPFSESQILILGLPVYAGRIPYVAESYVNNLKGENTLAIVVCVYGNRDFDDALREMKDILSERGFNVVAAGAFIGEHSLNANVGSGRPDENDINAAKKFADIVSEKINRIKNGNSVGDFYLKGNFPYKERSSGVKTAPAANENCVNCGECVNFCPVEAIRAENPSKSEYEKCIRCAACIKNCPYRARMFDNGVMGQTIAWLENNFMARKEPEFFI